MVFDGGSVLKSPVKSALLLLIRIYQLCISPMVGPRCRFYPTCSSYAMEAIRVHGAAMGMLLAIKRLCKCNPWHPGGFDPVPEKPEHASSSTTCSVTSPD